MPLTSGQTFAGYTIIRLLGSGGMGEVYLAQHPRLPRRDALKLLPREWSADEEYRARFNREADLASTLWHPHIVGVHDRGEEDGQLWISMDFVDGLDAARLLTDRYPAGMPVAEVVRIVTAVANALDYAHRQDLLHRDVKPANIMLTHLDDDGEQRVLLTDFGIARSVNDISGLTKTNFTVGTVAYAAPEQLMGQALDGRADQYALAATAYHLLTGSQLFRHSNPAVVISHHLNATPPTIAKTRPELAALDPVLAIALAKNPDDRFRHCRDFAHALTLARIRARSGDTRRDPAATQMAIDTEKPLTSATPVAEAKNPAASPNRKTGTKGPSASAPPTVGAKKRNSVAAKVISGDANEEGHEHGLLHRERGGWLTVVVVSGVVLLVVLAGVVYSAISASGGDRSSGATTASGGDRSPGATTVVSPGSPTSTTAATGLTTPPPPVTPTSTATGFPASNIDSVLPTPTVVSRVLGTANLQVKSTQGMSDHSGLVTPFTCVGVIFGADRKVYANSGFDAILDQTLGPANYSYSTTGPTEVEQTVAVFPTAQQAQNVLTSSQRQWQACAAGKVGYRVPGTNGEVGWDFDLGSVQLRDDILTVAMAGINNESGDNACQQALGIRANVIVGARTCLVPTIPPTATVADPNLAGQYAKQLASEILSGIHF